MANVAIIGSGVSVRNLTAIMAAFAVRGEKGEAPTMRTRNFTNGLADGLFPAFYNGLLHVGVTDFLIEHSEDNAPYPLDFTNDEILALCSNRLDKTLIEFKPAFANYANEICQSYADNLRAANINLEELEMAELQFMHEPMTVRSEVETAIETPIDEPLTVAQQLVEATADVLDDAADNNVSVYEAIISDETLAMSIDPPIVEAIVELAIINTVVNALEATSTTLDVPDAAELTEAEVLPETSEIVIPDETLTNDDLAINTPEVLETTVVDAPEVEELSFADKAEIEIEAINAQQPTLEAVEAVKAEIVVEMAAHTDAMLEAKLAAQEVEELSFDAPVAKTEFISTPKDLAATVAQVEGMGVFAAMALIQQPRELKAQTSATETIRQKAEARAQTQKKAHQPSRQKVALKAAKKQTAREFSITGVSFNAGKVSKAFAHCKALHAVYPYLGRMSNELGVPSPVGRVSMNIGGMNYATAGSHESNLQAGFFHPSCVITVNVLDGLANRIRPQQITVPYIIEAPVRFIDTPKGMQPNMVIEDADALRCCEPIWVQKNNLEGIVRAIAAGHKLIGEHKPFNRKQLFMVFMPAQPKWKSLNQAVEFSTPYPNGNKA